jgi:ABC-type branched-subunit amino acid transport system ATPase component/branched-subunit amino acid ABC-type transport system permease component
VLPYIVIGLTSGAVYALAGVGLVLTYKTSGVFNFAHGAVAAVGAYVFYALDVLCRWSWPLAAVVAILVAGSLMGLALELMARRIQTKSLALRVASTVGLLLMIVSAIQLIFGNKLVRTVPIFLGSGNVTLLGTNVQVAQIVTFLFAIAATAALTAFLRFSRRGIAMRAVVDNPELLEIAGTGPAATRRLAWVIGATLASASGVLFAPVLSLDPIQLTLLVVSAFGAAAIGAFTSLPLTLAGGLGIGILASLCTKWFTTGLLSGLPPSLPFVVLFAVLLVFPKKYLVGKSFTVSEVRSTWKAPAPLQLIGGMGLLIVLVLAPLFAGIHLTDWTTFVGMSIVLMSLSLLVRTSGQVSLAHVSFTAVGACAFSHLTVGSGVPWFIALILAGLIAVPIGALLAIPAIRLGGLYLALATFGFGVLLQGMFYTEHYMFGSNGNGESMPFPGIANNPDGKPYYYLVLILATCAALFTIWLVRSRLGRLLRGAADSAVALQTSGTSVNVTRVLVFCISAFMAAVGGALVGVGQSTISADSYQPILSLTWFTLIIVVLGGAPWNAVIAAAALFLIPSYVSGAQVTTVLQMMFGATAILYALLPNDVRGVPVGVQRLVDRTFGRIKIPFPSPGRPAATAAPVPPPMEGGLQVAGLVVRFGGLVAVDKITIHAPEGRVTGLIGPNGAGKTTTFNACTGLLKPSEGTVLIAGADVSRRGPDARARKGLGRTFQTMELFDSLTVRENVEAGAEGPLAGANPLAHVVARPGQRGSVRAAAEEAMGLCELTNLADTPAVSLSTGHRRLVELARCIAGPFGLLLLDEPSSGLDHSETARFGAILKRVVQERGAGILLVEHDMSLVLDICEQIYVLDFGELIFHGTPKEITSSPIVKAAYLGDSDVRTGRRSRPRRRAVGARPKSTATATNGHSEDDEHPGKPDALALHGVDAGYGRSTVLRSIDLSVAAGAIVVLLGPNGAGRTTLLRTAAGLLSPTAGHIALNAQDVTSNTPLQRAREGLCLIPEGRGIFPNLSVKENLLLQIPPWQKERGIDSALAAFPILKERLTQRAGSMSGGQQRMLALSRCFLANPRLVLLDEVSMGLAPGIIDEIFTALLKLRDAGVALLLVEQYVGRALAVADYVYLLARGRVRFSGAPSELDEPELMRWYVGGDDLEGSATTARPRGVV